MSRTPFYTPGIRLYCYHYVFAGRLPFLRERWKHVGQGHALPTRGSRLPDGLQKVFIGSLPVLVLTPRSSGQGPMEIQRCAMKDFHELKVWQKAHQLTLTVYQITDTFPREELYGLTAQLRRSCSSIPANLAEGCGRQWQCRVHPLQPASVPLRWDRLANSSITCWWPEI